MQPEFWNDKRPAGVPNDIDLGAYRSVVEVFERACKTHADRPAFSNMLPLVVVTAAFRFTSRPQHTSKLPFTAVTAAFTLTSRSAFKLKVVGLELAVQLTASFTKMSPLPGVVVNRFVSGGVPGVVASLPTAVVIVTLLVTSNAERVAPEILSVALPPMMKTSGSIRNIPEIPVGAAEVTRASG